MIYMPKLEWDIGDRDFRTKPFTQKEIQELVIDKAVVKNWIPNKERLVDFGKVKWMSRDSAEIDSQDIYHELETHCWAPWLEASIESLVGRAAVFPEGQLVIAANRDPLASLSTNKINWDGNPESLPSWDDVAGDPTTYEQTYVKDGNSLVLMSMNVYPRLEGYGLARKLIGAAKTQAVKLGVDYIIGSFRPNEFGKYKAQPGKWNTPFEEYCKMTREDGLPVDSWLRNLTRNGMKPLKVDPKAMTVGVPLDEFFKLLAYYHKNGIWKEVASGVWECGEVGNWKVDHEKGVATYQESNLWGILWSKTGSP